MNFCLDCGRPLDKKLNKQFEGLETTNRKFCRKKCKDAYERKQRPRNRKKYGVAGYCYDFKRRN